MVTKLTLACADLGSHRVLWHSWHFYLVSFFIYLVKNCCTETRSPSQHSGPSSTGGEASAEGEVDFGVLVFPPSTKRHHDDRTVVFSTIQHCLQGLEGRKRKTLETRVCTKRYHPSSGKSNWFHTVTNPITSQCLWFSHRVSMPSLLGCT